MRTHSAMALHALMLLTICGLPCDVSVPSLRTKICGCYNEIKIINTPNDNMFTIHRTLSDLELNNFNNKDKIDKTFK